MSILNRYVFRQLLSLSLAFVLIFVAIGVMMRSARFIDLIVNKGLPATDFLKITGLLVPMMVQVMLPLGCTIAVLFVFNRLHSDAEIIVHQSTGRSDRAIKFPALVLAVLYAAFLLFNGSWLMPTTYRAFENLRGSIGTNFAITMIEEQKFLDVGEKRTLFVREIRDGAMFGVMLRDESDPRQPSSVFARRAEIIRASDVPGELMVVALDDVTQIGTDERNGKPFRINSKRQVIDLTRPDQTPDDIVAQDPFVKPRALTLAEVQERIGTTTREDYRRRLISSLHDRLSSPLLLLAFVLLCVNVLLGTDRGRQGLSRQIWIVLISVAAFQVLAVMARDAIRDDDRLWVLLYINVAVVFAAAWLLPPVLKRLFKS